MDIKLDAINIKKQELINKIQDYEIISFDVFDTLIMRKTMFPVDVFEIVSKKIKSDHINIEDFRNQRIKADNDIARTSPNIYEIYDQLKKNTGISEIEKNRILQCEIETEASVLIRREDVVDLFSYAVNCEKSVYLISDMYLPKVIIEYFLSNLHIQGYEDILASCDYRRPKTGGLFDVFKDRVRSKSILHIGDNINSDIKCAQLAGMDTFHIESAIDLMKKSSFYDIQRFPANLNERSMIGLFIAYAFNSPFIAMDDKKRIVISNEYDWAYLFVAPLVTGFMVWLIKVLQTEKYEGILFSSRDGYLIKQLYDNIPVNYCRDILPEGFYFYVSRVACSKAAITNDKDIKWIAGPKCQGSMEKVVRERYEIEYLNTKNTLTKDDELLDYAMLNKERIYEKSKTIRRNFLSYINKLSIKDGKKYAFFDFVSCGSCQFFLNQVMPLALEGVYCCLYNSYEEQKAKLPIHSYFYNNHPRNPESNFFENYLQLEAIMTSYEPSIVSYDRDGRPVFADEVRGQDELLFVKKVQKAIKDFWCDFINNLWDYYGDGIRNVVVDELFKYSKECYTNIRCSNLMNMNLLNDFGQEVIEIRRK
ncbi:MAG: hypothetical protein LUF31_00655 [Fusobacterium sp.]|nr:hypothetical protein [Fusobacterium sp.]